MSAYVPMTAAGIAQRARGAAEAFRNRIKHIRYAIDTLNATGALSRDKHPRSPEIQSAPAREDAGKARKAVLKGSRK